MNEEIESQIITILLNHPEEIKAVNLNDNWFVDQKYRALYNAISAAGAEADLMSVYSRAMGLVSETLLPFAEVIKLKNQYLTDGQLQTLVHNLHRLAIRRDLVERASDYLNSPYEENLQNLAEVVGQATNLGTAGDDGDLDETAKELEERLTHEQPVGIKTFPKLDQIFGGGLYGSMLFSIGARPSVGKTAFSVNLAYQIMQHDPEVCIDYFTLEMNKREMLNRFVSRKTGVSSAQLRNPAKELTGIMPDVVRAAIKDIQQSNLAIYDGLTTIDQIIAAIRKKAARCAPNKYVAIIDYIGLISVPGISERYLQVGQITRELKITSNEFDIPIIALTQLNRSVESRQDKRPMLSDIRESGSVEQDSNVVGFLSRNEDNVASVVRLNIEKNREGELGQINFGFNGKEMLFMES